MIGDVVVVVAASVVLISGTLGVAGCKPEEGIMPMTSLGGSAGKFTGGARLGAAVVKKW